MPLDPRAERLLRMLSASAGAARTETAADRRRSLVDLTVSVGGEPPAGVAVDDLTCPGPAGAIPLRRYSPSPERGEAVSKGDLGGAVLFLHGGGWVAGDLDTHDGVCRRLALASGQSVLAVDYRLAPENPVPAGLQDAAAAAAWLATQGAALKIDPGKIVLAGDSAGGNLAAATALALRDRGGPPLALLLLICPILDLAGESASRQALAEGYFLSRAAMQRDLGDYAAPGADLADPRYSPLRAPRLSGLPPTHVHVAEFDPFRDEGLAFAARLSEAGVPATVTQHAGMIHYFYAMPGAIPYADTALAAIGAEVKAALDP